MILSRRNMAVLIVISFILMAFTPIANSKLLPKKNNQIELISNQLAFVHIETTDQYNYGLEVGKQFRFQ